MNKQKWLKIVNCMLFLCMLNQFITGIASNLINRSLFELLHPGGGVLLALLALIHIVLNWPWIRATYLK